MLQRVLGLVLEVVPVVVVVLDVVVVSSIGTVESTGSATERPECDAVATAVVSNAATTT